MPPIPPRFALILLELHFSMASTPMLASLLQFQLSPGAVTLSFSHPARPWDGNSPPLYLVPECPITPLSFPKPAHSSVNTLFIKFASVKPGVLNLGWFCSLEDTRQHLETSLVVMTSVRDAASI